MRNLKSTNFLPCRAMRACLKIAGPGDVARTKSQLINQTGENKTSSDKATHRSRARLARSWARERPNDGG